MLASTSTAMTGKVDVEASRGDIPRLSILYLVKDLLKGIIYLGNDGIHSRIRWIFAGEPFNVDLIIWHTCWALEPVNESISIPDGALNRLSQAWVVGYADNDSEVRVGHGHLLLTASASYSMKILSYTSGRNQ